MSVSVSEGKVRVGTSGFGYHSWSPGFFPSALPHADYLNHYARELDFCELNQTFFELPPPGWGRSLVEELPDGLTVSVKLNRRLTHERRGELTLARCFAERIRPLSQAKRLAAVVAQFPYAFVNNPDNRAYLCRLRSALELPVVVELRNPGWLRPDTLGFLRGWGLGLVAADGPGLERGYGEATSPVGYVRLHGRRPELWWRDRGRGRESRYDYRYRRKELLAWLPRLRQMERDTDQVFVVFNNHGSPRAIENVRALKKLLARSESRRIASTGRRPACAG